MVKIALIVVFLAIIVFILISLKNHSTQSNSESNNNSILFTVTVPYNTPPDEPIVLIYGAKSLVLTKVATHKYQSKLLSSEFSGKGTIPYGYSRGGIIAFGEYGLMGNDGTQMPRKFSDNDKVINDTITKWKWLPDKPLSEAEIPTQASSTDFKSRPQFLKGVFMSDFWSDPWPINYASTIKKLKDTGFDTIVLKPPVSLKSENPVEYVLGQQINCPSYPEDKLREEIRSFKQAGIKVILQPQVCANVNFTNKNTDWWKHWFGEMDKIITYHAKIAKEEKVDAFIVSYFGGLLDSDAKSLSESYWNKMIDDAKASGVPVGMDSGAWEAGNKEKYPYPIGSLPQSILLKSDFFTVGFTNSMVSVASPTQAQIDAGISSMMGQIDRLHNLTNKPVYIGAIGYQSKVGAGLPPGPERLYVYEDPDKIWSKYNVEYSGSQQAMIYESIMKEIAKRAYIEGILSWGYTYVDSTLTPDETIRGKMAERILKQWFDKIPQ